MESFHPISTVAKPLKLCVIPVEFRGTPVMLANGAIVDSANLPRRYSQSNPVIVSERTLEPLLQNATRSFLVTLSAASSDAEWAVRESSSPEPGSKTSPEGGTSSVGQEYISAGSHDSLHYFPIAVSGPNAQQCIESFDGEPLHS